MMSCAHMFVVCSFSRTPRRNGNSGSFNPGFVLGLALVVLSLVADQSRGQADRTPITLDEARTRFEEIRSRHGRLTCSDYLAVCRQHNRWSVAPKDIRPSWKLFLGLLHPPIQKSELIELLTANRGAIHDLRVVYTFTAEGVRDNGQPADSKQRREFAIEGAKILSRVNTPDDPAKHLEEDKVYSYDGRVVRTAQSRADGLRGASVDPFQSRSLFCDSDSNPLLLSMFADAEAWFEYPVDLCDLVRLLKMETIGVLEERHDVDGRPCIIVGDPGIRAFLDPERNFCLARFEFNTLQTDGPFKLDEMRKMSDVQDLGNGFWLPRKIVVDQYGAGGKPRLHREVHVLEWHVNEGLPEGYFSNVIPQGYLVADTVNSAAYVMGEKSTISGILDRTIPEPLPRLEPSRLWLLLINLAIFMATAAYIARRRMRRSPRG